MQRQPKSPEAESAGLPSEQDFARMENETFEKVSSTLGAIDRAISAWDASKMKPREAGESIDKLKRFQGSLNSWVKEFARVRGATRERRLGALVKFIEICYSYENS